MCPSFDFIKNRFKPKPKLKPESSDNPEDFSKEKRINDLDRDSIVEGLDQTELSLEQNGRGDHQRLAELSGKAISIEDAANRLRSIEEQKTDSACPASFLQ